MRLTADHTASCCARLGSSTSNGAGVVSALELTRGLDWASWKARRHSMAKSPRVRPGARARCWRCACSALVDTAQVVTLVETKHPTRSRDVEKALVQVLRSFDLADGDQPGRPRQRMMSFYPRALQLTHRLAPRLQAVYLVEAAVPKLSWDDSLTPRSVPSASTCGCCAASRPARPSAGLPLAGSPSLRVDRRRRRGRRPLPGPRRRRDHHESPGSVRERLRR